MSKLLVDRIAAHGPDLIHAAGFRFLLQNEPELAPIPQGAGAGSVVSGSCSTLTASIADVGRTPVTTGHCHVSHVLS